ncbi:hypothetical protein RJ639_017575 [Escallonia herrerae]|uniref:Kinesin-like protein n=1 Tax=Escallonia herrerae TaxID=1293975 RepID=A0AA88VEY0_9ASTE|nr:hypothetical protein RJ639_017575 [Escallonia herrerae]
MNPYTELYGSENRGPYSLSEVLNGNVTELTESSEGPSTTPVFHAEDNSHDAFQLKQKCIGDLPAATISEFMKLNSKEQASTRSLLNVANKILDESIERKNGDISKRVAYLLKEVVRDIERQISGQSEVFKKQNNLYKTREEKYQSKIRALEILAMGTSEENEVAMNQLRQLKTEKTKIEEKRKVEEQDVIKLMKEKAHSDVQISNLKQELELLKGTYEKHSLQMVVQAKETKVELEKKVMELECLLADSMKKVEALEAFSESKYLRWKKKELGYKSFIDFQSRSLQELRVASDSIKQEILKTQKVQSKEFNHFGMKLKGLVDAAQNYHTVLEENRKLYNEVQDLKGNIRVYCRIRPFLPGQSEKHTAIEYIGESGELVVANSSKQGKDSHRLFQFNKVFGPAATQEEVFVDTQPLIRSVLDGFNVCIFAYGQSGSGKTYTMSGPNLSSREDWGVNYRALHDLFHLSQSRRSSFTYEVGVQMVEIYNEQVRDLLCTDSSQKRYPFFRVFKVAFFLVLMKVYIIRSVLTVHVRGTDLKTNAVLHGSLHLVDLAGSERVNRSEATGDRLREAQHINKSLSALGDVIFALAQKSSHVPFRNSKLTQVLQSSLGGQAKTLMFVQLNPDVESYSETISTLKFAERVSGVELGAARSNKEGRGVRELMEQVAFLKDTVAKKDEEIGRLRTLKPNSSGEKRGISSPRYGSSSPRRHSMGTPRESRTLSGGKSLGRVEKASSDVDNSSDYSDRHSEAGSQQSLDDFRHHKEFFRQSRLAVVESGQIITDDVESNTAVQDGGRNLTEDFELLGFGDADSEERLSDISDGVLSMGTETDGSINSIVELTLFPETVKRPMESIEK